VEKDLGGKGDVLWNTMTYEKILIKIEDIVERCRNYYEKELSGVYIYKII